jgi:hypothetical protein
MLVNEAKWFRRHLGELQRSDLFPLLNIGSHTADFRRRGQPWIERQVFNPLRQRGGEIVHTDIRAAEGVDIVGDLLDPDFRAVLRQRQFRSIMFCNVLEHVSDRVGISTVVSDVVEPGGYLFVSAPHSFPYHPDPIDTMFRPGVSELAALFPETEMVAGAVVACGNLTTYALARFWPNPFGFLRRALVSTGRKSQHEPAQKHGGKVALLPWLVRSFAITCLVLRKRPARAPRDREVQENQTTCAC